MCPKYSSGVTRGRRRYRGLLVASGAPGVPQAWAAAIERSALPHVGFARVLNYFCRLLLMSPSTSSGSQISSAVCTPLATR